MITDRRTNMASVTITKGPQDQIGKHWIVQHRPLAGGRHPSHAIQLVDPKVSRRHFLIRVEGDDHVISESQAAHGVFVNGQRIEEHKRQHGDQIFVGATVLVYSKQDEADRTDAGQEPRDATGRVREQGTLVHDPSFPKPGRPS
jgi:pSer/pThr/pTyr-binding forkhead associated (FHA) protein